MGAGNMTTTQAYLLDLTINACFWLTWVGLVWSAIANHRIGND